MATHGTGFTMVFNYFLLIMMIMLGGCAQVPNTYTPQMGNLLLAEPAPINPRAQLAIARYNYILAEASLEDTEKADLFYQRGMLYDSVGLSGLAQFDYTQALNLKPNMAEAYNSMGVHYTQQLEFVQAYEAFDSSLDINPDYDFAFLNRGIALYYGGRPDLALSDLETFMQRDSNDPYRVLWRYIVHRETDPDKALANLIEIRTQLSKSRWATSLVDFYLGDITERELLRSLIEGVKSQKELTDRLCEAYFYLGKYHGVRGNRGIASNYFKLALSTNVYEYVEHRYARLELNRLRENNANKDASVR